MPTPTAELDFAEASNAVIDFLAQHIPLGSWSVSRYDGADQIHLQVRGEMIERGATIPWSSTLCQHVVAGTAPPITGDTSTVPALAAEPLAVESGVRSYVGIPLVDVDGEVFGTLCGLDPERHGDALDQHEPLLRLLASLLSSILVGDRARVDVARQLTHALEAAETDPLTGLANRRGWDRMIALEEARHARFGDPAAVLVIDLDGLKATNDQHGHAAGDALITTAGEVLRATVRATDTVARLGGDEFALLLPGTDTATATHLIGRLSEALAARGVQASIGSGAFTVAGGFADALRHADDAMYRAKSQRRSTRGDATATPAAT